MCIFHGPIMATVLSVSFTLHTWPRQWGTSAIALQGLLYIHQLLNIKQCIAKMQNSCSRLYIRLEGVVESYKFNAILLNKWVFFISFIRPKVLFASNITQCICGWHTGLHKIICFYYLRFFIWKFLPKCVNFFLSEFATKWAKSSYFDKHKCKQFCFVIETCFCNRNFYLREKLLFYT